MEEWKREGMKKKEGINSDAPDEPSKFGKKK